MVDRRRRRGHAGVLRHQTDDTRLTGEALYASYRPTGRRPRPRGAVRDGRLDADGRLGRPRQCGNAGAVRGAIRGCCASRANQGAPPTGSLRLRKAAVAQYLSRFRAGTHHVEDVFGYTGHPVRDDGWRTGPERWFLLILRQEDSGTEVRGPLACGRRCIAHGRLLEDGQAAAFLSGDSTPASSSPRWLAATGAGPDLLPAFRPPVPSRTGVRADGRGTARDRAHRGADRAEGLLPAGSAVWHMDVPRRSHHRPQLRLARRAASRQITSSTVRAVTPAWRGRRADDDAPPLVRRAGATGALLEKAYLASYRRATELDHR